MVWTLKALMNCSCLCLMMIKKMMMQTTVTKSMKITKYARSCFSIKMSVIV